MKTLERMQAHYEACVKWWKHGGDFTSFMILITFIGIVVALLFITIPFRQ